MDELYLEWLLSNCGLNEEKAQRVKRQYPTIENLSHATAEEISILCDLTIDEARTLKEQASQSLYGGDHWYKRDPSLFLCPNCGSFASAHAKICPQCGASFEEILEEKPKPSAPEEEKPQKVAEEKPPTEEEEKPELYICSNCGAFLSREAASCPSCAHPIEEAEAPEPIEEELPKIVVAEAEKEELQICGACGAFVAPGAKKCGICGHVVAEEEKREEEAEIPALKELEEALEPEAKEPRGVSKDFLARWQRVAEKTPTREEQLEEELRHYDELLQVDPRLERAWALKSHVLKELGRNKEAARCLEKAAKINPEREQEYKSQVLNLAETLADYSIIPPAWSDLTPSQKSIEEISAIQRALNFYERLLRADPKLDVAWETRAELLRRLGKDMEAEASLARAKEMRDAKAESERRALSGLRTVGMPRVTEKRREGRVNGLGKTNGLLPGMGRTNGLVNGLGRVNGLVNGLGRVNGLVNGLGRVNGLINGIGRTNGLINGNGFVNGRRGRFQADFRPHKGWMASSGAIAAMLIVLLAGPLIASLMTEGPPVPAFQIDGDFSDWSNIQAYPDMGRDTRSTAVGYQPDLDIIETKVAVQDSQLMMYARANGTLFMTTEQPATIYSVKYVAAVLDMDGQATTGYRVGGIGADRVLLLAGWAGSLRSARELDWDRYAGGGSDNFSAFRNAGNVVASSSGSEIEFTSFAENPDIVKVVMLTADTTGETDVTDAIAGIGVSTLVVVQKTLVADITTQSVAPFLEAEFRASAGAAQVLGINVTKIGTMEDQAVGLRLYRDIGDGLYDSADMLVGSANFTSDLASFNMSLSLQANERALFFLVADLTGAPDASSLSLRVSSVDSNAVVDLRDSETSGTYYRRAPQVTIDGMFGDWDRTKILSDAQWDVRSTNNSMIVNENVDIAETALNVTSDFAFYLKVFGRMLGGEDLPNLAHRPISDQNPDSDLDTVPDTIDLFPSDFNNDGIPDYQTNHDVDVDGMMDYPWGTDYWINTTIPSNFPPPYQGRIVSRYVGPISYNLPAGIDVAYAYIDADNSTTTGLYTEADGVVFGIDFAMVAIGRGGLLENASLFRYRANSAIPFAWIASANGAVDNGRIEMAVNSSILGLVPGYKVLAVTTDWMRNTDNYAPVLSRAGSYGIRSPAGDNVVINEVKPKKPGVWIELANPTNNSISLNGWRLQIFKGNKYLTVYAFTTESVGGWLSGTEYLAVTITSKDFPTSGGDLVLRDNNNVIVDRVIFGSPSSSESYARFKGANDGKPVDTDAAGDWYISTLPTPGAPNDRTRPIIRVVKTRNMLYAQPGDYIQYTIYYNNTGDGLSRRVWINDTLPAGVTYSSSGETPSSSSGQTYRWIFNNVPPGAQRSFTITVRVNGNVSNGASLINAVSLNYTDQLLRSMGESRSWGNVTVRRPVIQVAKTASPSIAGPGSFVTYTIYYNNTGSISAARVWINDTLPDDVTFIFSSVPPSSSSGQTYRWIFSNVGVGAHSFTITVRVNSNPTSSILVNWVFLNYTSANGYQLEQSSDSATVLIPEFQEIAVPLTIPLLLAMGHHLRKRKGKKSEAVADSVPPTNGR